MVGLRRITHFQNNVDVCHFNVAAGKCGSNNVILLFVVAVVVINLNLQSTK